MNTRIRSWAGRLSLVCLLGLVHTPARAQSSNTSAGWFVRGTGTNFTDLSFVIPLDGQHGVTTAPSLAATFTNLGFTSLYHLNATNPLSQNILTNRIPITNAVAAFGGKYGGSPLYLNQAYRFGAYAGDFTSASNMAIGISVINRTSGAWMGFYNLGMPYPSMSDTNDWNTFIANGNIEVYPAPTGFGLSTTIYADWIPGTWGILGFGNMIFTHTADTNATNYEYTIWVAGTAGANWMAVDSTPAVFWSPLYTLTFDPQPPMQPNFVSQPQFSGKPLPPFYQGASLAELQAVKTVVNNTVNSAATTWTDLDDSPELRDHVVLDQFVKDMGSNALALTSYVFNRIALCDAVTYNSNTNALLDASINLGGINRSAYSTYMEGQGSPTEQCALLVYLLRRAGVPACYIFGPTDGIQMLDSQLSSLLRMQVHGAVNQNTGQVYTTNTLISVNFPWVAAYVGGQWVHLFPWLKNTEVTEGLNLYDYMPSGYENGALWIYHYLTNDTSIFSLSTETDVPSTLFPLFVQKYALLPNAPGVSLDDLGTTAVNRQVEYNHWSDFPTPFQVTNGAVTTVQNLTTITTNSGFSTWTNIWDTISVRVFSTANPTTRTIYTGDLRMCDLQDRKFIVRHQTNTSGGGFTLTLSLAPYQPSNTTVKAFTNDASLTNQETLTIATLTTADDNISITITNKRHRLEPTVVTNDNFWASYLGVGEVLQTTNTKTIKLGDLAAICLHSGSVSQQMLTPWAQEYWAMQQAVAATPSLTNTLSPDITQGTLPYLMGMSYYERCGRFLGQLADLHKVQLGTMTGIGLSVIGAQRNTNTGALLTPIVLYHPHVDMLLSIVSSFANNALRPDEGGDAYAVSDSFFRLFIAEASAQEHKITQDFYSQTGGISSVRLLLEAQKAGGPGVVELDNLNYQGYATANPSITTADPAIWQLVVNAFTAPTNYTANVFITKSPVTDTTTGYKGMGALIFAPNVDNAPISGNGLPANGGWGDPFPTTEPFFNPPDFNFIDLSFNSSFDNNWSASYVAPTIAAPDYLSESVTTWDTPSTWSYINTGAIISGGVDVAQQQSFDFASFNLGFSGAGAPALAYSDTVNNGGNYDPHVGIEYAQVAGNVVDPVNAVTGEFYIDSTDLTLPGAMPLVIRRNYSSQDVDLGDTPFGDGWRPAYTPYLRVITNNNVIYAAEMDGTVVAYRQPFTGTNRWVPTPADNPQLNNRSSRGVGSTANLFNNYITTNIVSGVTNVYLNGADGSVRVFQWAGYPLPGTNNFNRYRPYLQTWTDASGNSYTFSYQTDSTQPDYGQLLRVQSSNGNFLGFYYDAFAHITQAYTEDGRRLNYDYDSHGDLVTVTFPDESQINYVYQHTNSVTNVVTGGVTNTITNIYSTHLITQEQKPDGRTLANTYDTLRRVSTQAATVGNDLNLVTNATFTYSNTFTNLTNTVITGTTSILDVFGHTNAYQYTSNLITSITDQQGQIISQVWFTNSSDTGYYPHSLKSQTDKRKLNTAFQYDAYGNLAQVVQTGNLTGGTATNETATSSFTYTAKNLVSTATDPIGNVTAYYYTNSSFPMLPTSVVKLAGSTPVTTNQYFYTNVSQTVSIGGVNATYNSYGLVQKIVRGGIGSNDFLLDGRGFMTQSTRYTGTADPAVTTTFFYDDRGELSQRTDSLGRSHLYAYDGMGRRTQDEVYESGATTPEGFNYSYYSANGDVVWTDGSRYNPEDYVWRDYDGAGRKITEMRWRSEANTNGSGVETPSAANLYATTFYLYDTFNNLIRVTDPLGNYVTNQYDNIGQLTKSIAFSAAGVALATNQYAHEAGGQVSILTNPLGGVATMQYTYTGKPMYATNADGSTNGWRYDLTGRVVTEYLNNSNYWQTTYNDASLSVTRVYNNATTPLATNVVTMDTRGNVIQKIDADGYASTNVFDALDRIRFATSGPTLVITSTGMTPGTNFTTNVIQQTLTYFYDAGGQTVTSSNALGETTVTTSDALGRPTQVSIYPPSSGTAVRVTSTAYSADHQSVTVTKGTGGTAIASTTYTDNDGHPVLTLGSPTNGVSEFTWWQYDLAGNRIAQQQCSSNGSGFTIWATNGWTYDGLNRMVTETSRDGATTTYGLDGMGNVTNRAMPGGVTWIATYLNDGRIASEQEKGGSLTARSSTYTYFSAGTPFAGLLQSITDGRSTTRNNTFDDFFRLASVFTTGSAASQQTLTAYSYDPRGSLLSLAQSFSNSATGPATTITRAYDADGHILSEANSLGGIALPAESQAWDDAGRRTGYGFTSGALTYFTYQADGLMTGANAATFTYGNNGLLTARNNSTRAYAVSLRDGRGRIVQDATTTLAGIVTNLAETLHWRNDGRLASYTAVRGDFTDTRNYSYSTFADRLTQESFNVASGQTLSNAYTIDNGATGGLGILTSSAQSSSSSGTWSVPSSGGLDGLSRVAKSQNTVLNRPAYGTALGAAVVTATLNGNPVGVQFDGPDADGSWHADLNIPPGTSTLIVSAVDLSGTLHGAATNVFTATGGATDTVTNVYDGNGNVTQRLWISSGGVTNRIQNLTWDAFDRLISVADRDTNSSGYNFVSIFDGLGRRLRTIQTLVTNGVAITSPANAISTVDSWYDPQVEFLEVAVVANNLLTQKTYGPDASGVYGGMQGVGGLEAINQNGFVSTDGVVQDYFGNILATLSMGTVTWNPARFSSYGPAAGYQPQPVSLNTGLEQALGWHGKSIDPSGIYQLGARSYDPMSGRFMSADPLGHGGSQDLYSFCGGDPLNYFDPTGRYGKQMGGDVASYGAMPGAPDLVWQMHAQEVEAGIVNILTFGIADPLSGALTGYDLNGNQVNQGMAANNAYLAVMLALPLLVPGAGEAEVAAREGADILIGAGERGLVDLGENALAGSGERALAETGGQLEFGFAQQLESAPVGNMTQQAFQFEGTASQATQLELNFSAGSVASPNSVMRANANIMGTYIDPLSGNTVAANGTLAADHIVPQNWIKSQPGFDNLTTEQQGWLLNHPLNTQGLPQSLNASKGATMPGDWQTYKGQPLNPDYIQNEALRGQFLQNWIQLQIDQFSPINR